MKNLAIGLTIVLVVVICGFFFLVGNINSVVKQGIETAGPEMMGAPVEVAAVEIALLSGSGKICGLRVGNPSGYEGDTAFEIDSIAIELDPRSLISDRIHIKSIVIDSPAIIYEGNLSDSNIQKIQRNVEAMAESVTSGSETGADSSAEPGQSVQIDYLALKDAKIDVALSFLKGDNLSLVLPSLEMADIGKGENISMADAMQRILKTLNQSLIPLIRDNAGNFESQFKEQGEKLKESVSEGINKLKSLFN